MAVLAPPIHIKDSPLECIRYLQDPQKIVASGDTMNVIQYMQSHCIEELASVGYHGTSGICELAVEQFRLAEAQYNAIHHKRKDQEIEFTVAKYLETYHKKTLPPKLKISAPTNCECLMSLDDAVKLFTSKNSTNEQKEAARMVLETYKITVKKTANSAEHLVVSFHKLDRVSPELIQTIANEFMNHPYLRDFPALSNIHWNTDEKHIHFLICNYAKNGSRKLSINGRKLKEFRRYLDKLCYTHGLSIIDTQEARLDPEHSKWIDDVRAEGKIKVWDEKKVSASWKKRHTQAIARHEDQIAEENSSAPDYVIELATDYARNELFLGDNQYLMPTLRPMIPEEFQQYMTQITQKKRKDTEQLEKKKQSRSRETDQRRAHYYTCRYVYDRERHRWRQRSLLELLFGLAVLILTENDRFLRDNYPRKYEELELVAQPDYHIQAILDAGRLADELNARTPKDLQQRISEIGARIGEKKRAVAYDRATIKKGETLYTAIQTWQNPSDEDARVYAYAVMSACNTTTTDDISDFLLRYNRAKARLPENEEDLRQLSRLYREAKKAYETLNILNIKCQRSNQIAHDAALESPILSNRIQNASQKNTHSKEKKKNRDNSR